MTRHAGQTEPALLSGELDRGRLLAIIVAAAFVIRIYLALTNYCISGDGVSYVLMANEFAAGNWRAALGSVFSPLYPLMIAALKPVFGDVELTGELISVLMGTAAVGTIYLMTREAFCVGRDDAGTGWIPIGAAGLSAIHPDLAAYSGSVRTEAGYIFLTTTAAWLIMRASNKRRLSLAAASGIVAGLAYLFRTEGIGFIVLGVCFFPAASSLWRMNSLRWALCASVIFAFAMAAIATPYVVALHGITGRWTLSREFTAAMMYGMGGVADNSQHWRNLGFSTKVSPLAPIFVSPRLYLEKVAADSAASAYAFAKAMGPLLSLLMIIGLWSRGREIGRSAGEILLAALVGCYFAGFSLSYTGARFMVHLIPFALGWVVIGIERMTDLIPIFATARTWRIPKGAFAGVVALSLIPQTLWPLGYDMRGVRYAGKDIAKYAAGPRTVVARDGRFAYYAGAQFIELPDVNNLCRWLEVQDRPDFLIVGNRDERRFNVSADSPCLRFMRRYPRYGSGYYDLYAVEIRSSNRSSDAVSQSR